MGVGVLAFMALLGGNRPIIWVLVGVQLMLALVALAGAAVVALDVPMAWAAARGAGSPEEATGIKVLTTKTLALCGLYGVGGSILAVKLGLALRRMRSETVNAG